MQSFRRTRAIHRPTADFGSSLVVTLALACLAGPAPANETAAGNDSPDSNLTLDGGEDGTVFKSLTIEEENRVQITFERPELIMEVDPSLAPGLTWGSSMDVLNRTVPDLTTPLLRSSSLLRSPYQVRPWLTAYQTGPAATFTSDLKNVDRWQLQVVDSRGNEVVRFEGKKNPPPRIEWDGDGQNGTRVPPGLTYSYILEAFDKAGNKRRFVGEGFQLEAYRRNRDEGPEFLISGKQWRNAERTACPHPSAYLMETAGWINLKAGADVPVLVTATAGTYAEAQSLGDQVAAELRPLLPGSDSRVAVFAVAEPGFPSGGVLHIRTGLVDGATGD